MYNNIYLKQSDFVVLTFVVAHVGKYHILPVSYLYYINIIKLLVLYYYCVYTQTIIVMYKRGICIGIIDVIYAL